MTNWWDDPQYDYAPMDYPDRSDGPKRRIALTTDPVMVRSRTGALRLKLVNRHPHERLSIHVGSRQTARA